MRAAAIAIGLMGTVLYGLFFVGAVANLPKRAAVREAERRAAAGDPMAGAVIRAQDLEISTAFRAFVVTALHVVALVLIRLGKNKIAGVVFQLAGVLAVLTLWHPVVIVFFPLLAALFLFLVRPEVPSWEKPRAAAADEPGAYNPFAE